MPNRVIVIILLLSLVLVVEAVSCEGETAMAPTDHHVVSSDAGKDILISFKTDTVGITFKRTHGHGIALNDNRPRL